LDLLRRVRAGAQVFFLVLRVRATVWGGFLVDEKKRRKKRMWTKAREQAK
jgi:hypothetical protein